MLASGQISTILHGYPLSIVEHEGMRCFTKSLNPAFNMASSIDIEEFSTILFQERKADLKKKIALSSHRVSLSACLLTHGSEGVKYGPVLQVMFRLVSACFSLFSLTEHY
jgi:hypothetical protein